MLDPFGMNFDLTGAVSDDEPGDEQNRPLRGYRKKWQPSPNVAAESQEETVRSDPGGNLDRSGPYGPLVDFGFEEDACCIYDWIHVTDGLTPGALEPFEPSSPAEDLGLPKRVVELTGPQAHEPAWQQCATSAAVKRQRMDMLKWPWEKLPFDFTFILLQDPLATQTGTGIKNILNGGGAYHLVEQSVGGFSRSKVSSTLQKSAGSFWRLCKRQRLGGTMNPLRSYAP